MYIYLYMYVHMHSIYTYFSYIHIFLIENRLLYLVFLRSNYSRMAGFLLLCMAQSCQQTNINKYNKYKGSEKGKLI